MPDVDFAGLADIALLRFLFVFFLSLFVLIVLFFHYKYQPLFIGILLWVFNLLALAQPLLEWIRLAVFPDSEWGRQMLELGRNAAFYSQYFEWCALGAIGGLCTASLVAFLGRDLWREPDFLLFK